MTGEFQRISILVLLAILILPYPSSGLSSCGGGDCEWALLSSTAHESHAGTYTIQAYEGAEDADAATVTITTGADCSPCLPHRFQGLVTIDGKPAPETTEITAAGPGVFPIEGGNPVLTQADGSFGSDGVPDRDLVVWGCIDNGTPLAFSVNGIPAEVRDRDSGGAWYSTYPFRPGSETTLDIRIQSLVPPPDDVYINSLGITISNSSYGFFHTMHVEKNPWIALTVTGGVFDIHLSATGFHDFHERPVLGRSATLGIYEAGSLVSSEITVPFGSKTVTYDYVADETKTFDILIYVTEQPEIFEVKHLTITAISRPDTYTITATAGPGGSISPGGDVTVEAGAAQRFEISPSLGYQIADVIVDGRSEGAISGYTFSDVHADSKIHAIFSGLPPGIADLFDAYISSPSIE